jgi:quercetin dioxygenase-like cupin family protein
MQGHIFSSKIVQRMLDSIEIVREEDLKSGAVTPGITRHKAFENPNFLLSRTTINPNNISAWHHHGKRELFGFVLTGRLNLEYEGGSAKVMQGDFFRVPVGLVHRDVNPEPSVTVVVNMLVGEGELVVNVNPPA